MPVHQCKRWTEARQKGAGEITLPLQLKDISDGWCCKETRGHVKRKISIWLIGWFRWLTFPERPIQSAFRRRHRQQSRRLFNVKNCRGVFRIHASSFAEAVRLSSGSPFKFCNLSSRRSLCRREASWTNFGTTQPKTLQKPIIQDN